MSKPFIVSLAAIVLVAGFTGCSKSPNSDLPQPPDAVSITPRRIDLGNVVQFSTTKTTLRITNLLSEDIKILSIRRSCGCTQATTNAVTLKSRDSALLAIAMSPDNRVGEFGAEIKLDWKASNSGKTGVANATVLAHAQRAARISPGILELGDIDVDSWPGLLTASLEVDRGDANFDWDGILTNLPVGKVGIERVSENKFRLSVSIDPKMLAIGANNETMTLTLTKSKSATNQVYIVPLRLKIISDIQVSPQSLYFGAVSKRSTRQGTIEIESQSKKLLSLRSIECSNSFLKCGLLRSTPGKLIFSYTTNDATQGDKSGMLRIKVSSDRERAVAIPYIAYVTQ